MATEKEGEKAWEIHNHIADNEVMRRELMLSNMKHIHELHSTGLYKVVLGDEDAPWSAYLGLNETYYSSSKIYILDKVYQKFIKELELETEDIRDIPISKLSNLINVITKENSEEWLNNAHMMTTQDFNDELRKAAGKISYLDCKHENEIEYKICQICGNRHKI